MPPERTSERLKRILVLVPWVIAHPGVRVPEVCARFVMTPEELAADLDLLFVCGLPPFGPGDLIVAYIEDDQVVIDMADYLARPPRLTREEAMALLVMGRAIARLPGVEEAASLRSALEKLADAVSPADEPQASDLLERVAVEMDGAGSDLLGEIRAAIEERAGLEIMYYSHGRDALGARTIDPLLVFGAMGNWYVVAHDHRSGEERVFRIDRIRRAERTGVAFVVPVSFDPDRYRDGRLFTPSVSDIDVVIEISPPAAWMREVIPHERAEELDDGWTRIELRTGHLGWLTHTMLSVGPAARAVAPQALADDIRAAAARALAAYDG